MQPYGTCASRYATMFHRPVMTDTVIRQKKVLNCLNYFFFARKLVLRLREVALIYRTMRAG